jgi:hypothetical protein
VNTLESVGLACLAAEGASGVSTDRAFHENSQVLDSWGACCFAKWQGDVRICVGTF